MFGILGQLFDNARTVNCCMTYGLCGRWSTLDACQDVVKLQCFYFRRLPPVEILMERHPVIAEIRLTQSLNGLVENIDDSPRIRPIAASTRSVHRYVREQVITDTTYM